MGKFKLTPEMGIGLGLAVVGIVNAVLTGTKDKLAKDALKEEITKDVIENLSKKEG